MKSLLTFTFLLFSVVCTTAQDLLLSEDFDYPVGANLNQHNWKPLTASTDNPVKVVNGLKNSNFSASGGAAYLNKNGQDVIRSYPSVSNGQIFLSFQIQVLNAMNHDIYNSNEEKPNPSNHFMFLSSKEEPTKPLLKLAVRLVNNTIQGTRYFELLMLRTKAYMALTRIAPKEFRGVGRRE